MAAQRGGPPSPVPSPGTLAAMALPQLVREQKEKLLLLFPALRQPLGAGGEQGAALAEAAEPWLVFEAAEAELAKRVAELAERETELAEREAALAAERAEHTRRWRWMGELPSPGVLVAAGQVPSLGYLAAMGLPDALQVVADLDARQTVLDGRQADLDAHQADLDGRQADLDARRTDLDGREADLDAVNGLVQIAETQHRNVRVVHCILLPLVAGLVYERADSLKSLLSSFFIM